MSETALAFAAEGRLEDVSVSELAQRAGVTRDTFYRHTTSVPVLLAEALGDELTRIGLEYAALAATSTQIEIVVADSTRALFAHISEYASVYRTALTGGSSAPLRRILTTYVEGHLDGYLRAFPEIAPVPASSLDDAAIALFVGFGAAGTVGAIESWLRFGDTDDIDGATRFTMLAAAPWWSAPPPRE